MKAQMANGLFPGAVWLVAQGDDVAVDMIGKQAIGGVAPMRRDTIFRIASMTKPVTAACVMMLIEDGKVEIEAPVTRWLPELADRHVLRSIDGPLDDTVPAKRDMTVRDLLANTLGFGVLFEKPPIQQRIDELQMVVGKPVPLTPHAPDEWIKLFATLPLMHQPGEGWMYTAGSLLQGVLVRRASGWDLDAFMHERIFGPLGMKDSGFFVPTEKLGRFADCGIFTEQGKKTRMDKDGTESAYAKPPVFPAGDAGLVSTVDDYLSFARMLLNGGKHGNKQLLRAESVREMTRDQLTPEQKSSDSAKKFAFMPDFFVTHGWGYGLAISTAPDSISKVPGRYGWDGGFGTSFIVDPNRDLIGIVMTQSTDYLFNGARDEFWRELYTATA
jgi:CubicO group peptidase (beta-lactamase class C family)